MMFVQSLKGISHNKIEDTQEEHLELAVTAFDKLASKTIEWIRTVMRRFYEVMSAIETLTPARGNSLDRRESRLQQLPDALASSGIRPPARCIAEVGFAIAAKMWIAPLRPPKPLPTNGEPRRSRAAPKSCSSCAS